MSYDSLVARNLNRIIAERGLKKYAVAKMAGIRPQQFSYLLNGRKRFETYHIIKTAQALEVTPNELFSEMT